MRPRRLLMRGWLPALVLAACAPAVTTPIPPDAGLVPLQRTDDGGTLWLYGELTVETFRLDSIRVDPARLASRSPDPDEFRVMLLDSEGEPRLTVSSWSPLGVHVWDSVGVQESYRTATTRTTAIPVPVRPWLASVRLVWPSGAQVAQLDVSADVKRFCVGHLENPGCRK